MLKSKFRSSKIASISVPLLVMGLCATLLLLPTAPAAAEPAATNAPNASSDSSTVAIPEGFDETRGRIRRRISLCDSVNPPNCPKGCKEDKANNICVSDKQ